MNGERCYLRGLDEKRGKLWSLWAPRETRWVPALSLLSAHPGALQPGFGGDPDGSLCLLWPPPPINPPLSSALSFPPLMVHTRPPKEITRKCGEAHLNRKMKSLELCKIWLTSEKCTQNEEA